MENIRERIRDAGTVLRSAGEELETLSARDLDEDIMVEEVERIADQVANALRTLGI